MCAERYVKQREKEEEEEEEGWGGVVTKNRATVAHMPDTER